MAFLLNTIYISSPGPTKHNANNVLYLSGHTSFPHGVHESLVVECSLMRVLRLRFPLFTSAFTSWLIGAFELIFMKDPVWRREGESVIQLTHVRIIHTRIVRFRNTPPVDEGYIVHIFSLSG